MGICKRFSISMFFIFALLPSDLQAGKVESVLSSNQRTYRIQLSKRDAAHVNIGKRVELELPDQQKVIVAKIIAQKQKLIKVRLLTKNVHLNPGQMVWLKSLDKSAWADRFFISNVGAGFGIKPYLEFHSNTDLTYGAFAMISARQDIDLQLGAGLGVHQKSGGKTVDITELSAGLKFFPSNVFYISAKAKYKLYQESFSAKTQTSQRTSSEQQNQIPETSLYNFHDEMNIYGSAGVGLAFYSKKSTIGKSFAIEVGAGVEFVILELDETIPDYNPLDENLIDIDDTIWTRASVGYIF